MAGKKIGAVIALDGEKEFRGAITGVRKELDGLKAQLELTKEKFAGQANSLEALKAKHEILAKTLEAQKRKMEENQKGLEHAKKSYENVGKGLEKLKGDYEAAKTKMEDMKNSSGHTEEELQKQESAVRELGAAIRRGEENYQTAESRVRNWEVQLTRSETEVYRANNALSQNEAYMQEARNATDGCATSIDEYGRSTRRASQESQEFGQSARQGIDELAGVLVSAGVTQKVQELAKALYECVEEADKFETGMAKVYTIADQGSVSVDAMKESVMALSNETGIASQTIEEDVYNAISAGQDTADSVNFVSNSTKLATAGFAETSQTLDVLTTILNAYGMGAKDVTKVSDILVQTQNKGKVTVGQLSSSMGKIIPTANASNVSLEQLAAGYAIMTSKGIAAAETTTYMNSMLNELSKSGTVASTELKDATGSSFQNLMADGKSLGEVLQILQQQAGESGKSLADMFGSAEAGKAAVSLLSGGVSGFNSQVKGMQESAGATEAAFQKMSQTAEFAKKRFENSANNLKIAIGEQLSPALKKLNETGEKAFNWATGFVQKNPWIVNAVTGLTAAVLLLVTGVTGLLVAKKAAEAMKALNISMAANPILLVASAVIGLGVALKTYAASLEPAKTECRKFTDEVRQMAGETEKLKEQQESGKAEFDEATKGIEAECGALQAMSDRLYELSEKENKSNAEKAEMQMLVDNLNGAIPELNIALDEQNKIIGEGKGVVDSYIESMKQRALLAAYEEELTENFERQAKAQKKANDVYEKRAEAQRKIIEIEKEREKLVDDPVKDLDHLAQLDQEENEYRESIKTCTEEIRKNNEIKEESDEAIKGLVGSTSQLRAQQDKETEAASKAADAERQKAEADEVAAESAKVQEEALDALYQKYDEVKQSIQQSIEQKISLFDVFDGGEEVSLDEMIKNLESQFDGLTKWKENMEKLAAEVGDTIGPELYKKLAELGPGSAKVIQELVDALEDGGEEGKSKVKKISDELAANLDISEQTSKSMAAAQMILKTALGEMEGSSEADFSGLRDSIDEAVESAAEGWGDLPKETREALERAVEAAQQSGARIPEGLAEAIKSGEMTPAEAIAKLNGNVQAQFQFLTEMAEAAGITIPEDIQAGILKGGDDAVKAIAKLNKLFKNEQEKGKQPSQDSGKENAKAYGAGTESVAGEVTEKVANTVRQAVSTENSFYSDFYHAGINLMSGTVAGMTEKSPAVANAAEAAVERAVQAAKNKGQIKSPSKVFRDQVGAMMAEGMALGIRDGQKDVSAQAASLAWSAISAAREELDIHSPSKVFVTVGRNIGDGLKIGIEGRRASAIKASRKLSREVYQGASEWVKEYKKLNGVSLKQEEQFWAKVAKTVKKGSSGYKKAVDEMRAVSKKRSGIQGAASKADTSWTRDDKKKTRKTNQEYYNDLFKAAKTYFDNYESRHKLSLQEEKYYWEQIRGRMEAGTQGYYDAQKKVKAINKQISKETKEAQEEAAEDAISTTQSIIDDRKKYGSITAAEETAMWDKLTKKARQKGGKYYMTVKKQAREAKKEIAQANKEFGLSGSGLDMYKTYYNVSAKAEMQYWDTVRGQFKKGTTERIEADRKYLEAKEDYNSRLKDLQTDYYEKCQDVKDKLKDDVEDLTKSYEDAFQERKESIKSAFGTFDEFYSEAEAPEKLLANMQSQTAGYALWMEQMQELGGKGILNDKFLEELKKMGPEAAATIMSLNMMSGEQLKQANEAWKKKDELAEAQAAKETEALRVETEKKIKEITDAAQEEMDAYKAQYQAASAELSGAIEGPLLKLAKDATKLGETATARFVAGIGGKAQKKAAARAAEKVKNQVTDTLKPLKKAGKEIGRDMLAGLLSGLGDRLEIGRGAKSIVGQIEAAIKKEAGISSPSKRFRDAIGRQLSAGVAAGVDEGSAQAARAGTNMVGTILEAARKKLAVQREPLSLRLEGINGGAAIAAVNKLAATPAVPKANITVNNTGVAGLVSQMAESMQEMAWGMGNLKVVLDDGTLVGRIAPGVGNQLAAMTRRTR